MKFIHMIKIWCCSHGLRSHSAFLAPLRITKATYKGLSVTRPHPIGSKYRVQHLRGRRRWKRRRRGTKRPLFIPQWGQNEKYLTMSTVSVAVTTAQCCNSLVWWSARWPGGAGRRRSHPAGPGWSWWAPALLRLVPLDLHKSPPPWCPPPLVRHGRAHSPAPAAAPATHSTSWSDCRQRCCVGEVALFYIRRSVYTGPSVTSGKYNRCPSNTARC